MWFFSHSTIATRTRAYNHSGCFFPPRTVALHLSNTKLRTCRKVPPQKKQKQGNSPSTTCASSAVPKRAPSKTTSDKEPLGQKRKATVAHSPRLRCSICRPFRWPRRRAGTSLSTVRGTWSPSARQHGTIDISRIGVRFPRAYQWPAVHLRRMGGPERELRCVSHPRI